MRIIEQYDAKSFSEDVVSRWGSDCPWLVEDEGQLHSQMAHLAALCLTNKGQRTEVFAFLEGLLGRGDAVGEIENAVAISFLDWGQIRNLEPPERLSAAIHSQWERDSGGN